MYILIDIHSHILPGIDDGPPDFVRSLAMAKQAANAGITHLFATPHHMNGRYENLKGNIMKYVQDFNAQLEQENIPLLVHPGQELRVNRELFISLEMEEVMTLDNKGQYLLLELPSGEVPNYTQEVVYELLLKGITPIIVHPERNKGFLEDNNLLFDLVLEGALTQVTAGSIIGHFGKKVKTFAERIIEHHLTHFIATDAHNITTRGFQLIGAYEAITKGFGIDHTFYFQENAELLLLGQYPHKEQPIPIRKKFLGIF